MFKVIGIKYIIKYFTFVFPRTFIMEIMYILIIAFLITLEETSDEKKEDTEDKKTDAKVHETESHRKVTNCLIFSRRMEYLY